MGTMDLRKEWLTKENGIKQGNKKSMRTAERETEFFFFFMSPVLKFKCLLNYNY